MENYININDQSNGRYAEKLGITTEDGFKIFMSELEVEARRRVLTHAEHNEDLTNIFITLNAFDGIKFDDFYSSMLVINNKDKFMRNIESVKTYAKLEKWLERELVRRLSYIIDEDLNNKIIDSMIVNLREVLCTIDICINCGED